MFKLSCKNISRIIFGNDMQLSLILSVMAKAVNTYIHTSGFFFIFNIFTEINKKKQ